MHVPSVPVTKANADAVGQVTHALSSDAAVHVRQEEWHAASKIKLWESLCCCFFLSAGTTLITFIK